jgi:hypothetical protein
VRVVAALDAPLTVFLFLPLLQYPLHLLRLEPGQRGGPQGIPAQNLTAQLKAQLGDREPEIPDGPLCKAHQLHALGLVVAVKGLLPHFSSQPSSSSLANSCMSSTARRLPD